ncbi:uncharacterized protein LOC124647698 [Lolium rigidum]|uniref:uncharacterized protein LOC124647698 n=1 Tax=Lolium rigidum TaxID=89674 RepID=UPI001F5C7D8A|nr:uncharacterized protein LOC124647698 [Lolium rigidum]
MVSSQATVPPRTTASQAPRSQSLRFPNLCLLCHDGDKSWPPPNPAATQELPDSLTFPSAAILSRARDPVDRDGSIDGFVGASVGVDVVGAAMRGQRRHRRRWKIGAQPPALAGRTVLHRACLGRSTSPEG